MRNLIQKIYTLAEFVLFWAAELKNLVKKLSTEIQEATIHRQAFECSQIRKSQSEREMVEVSYLTHFDDCSAAKEKEIDVRSFEIENFQKFQVVVCKP